MTDKPLRAHLCMAPDCSTMVIGEAHCCRHRAPAPAGACVIAEQIRDKHQDELDPLKPKGKS
jgi:hypothetical protein